MTLLRLADVSRQFGRLKALDNVSFEMPKGQLRAAIGPNGAGKTTFFNLVTGFFPANAGSIWFDGNDITNLSERDRVQLGIVRTFQITEVFPDLSVFENLRMGVESAEGVNGRPWISRSLRAALDRRVDELIEITQLTDKVNRVVGELAHGFQRVVEVAIALSMRPSLLMLDEPTAGMAEEETEHMVDLIRRLHADQGLSILFIEHDMDLVFGIAQQITVLDQGRIIADGTPDEISRDEAVQAAYLGDAGE
jgi:branched-chain amino acid transport system ATP-binding protein